VPQRTAYRDVRWSFLPDAGSSCFALVRFYAVLPSFSIAGKASRRGLCNLHKFLFRRQNIIEKKQNVPGAPGNFVDKSSEKLYHRLVKIKNYRLQNHTSGPAQSGRM